MDETLKRSEKLTLVGTAFAFSLFGFLFSYFNVHDFDLFFIPIIVSGVAYSVIVAPIEAWALRRMRIVTFSENRHWVCGSVPSFIDYLSFGWTCVSTCILIIVAIIAVDLIYSVYYYGIY